MFPTLAEHFVSDVDLKYNFVLFGSVKHNFTYDSFRW